MTRNRGTLAWCQKALEMRPDFKPFNFSGHRLGIAQVLVLEARPLAPRHAELLKAMQQVKDEQIST